MIANAVGAHIEQERGWLLQFNAGSPSLLPFLPGAGLATTMDLRSDDPERGLVTLAE